MSEGGNCTVCTVSMSVSIVPRSPPVLIGKWSASARIEANAFRLVMAASQSAFKGNGRHTPNFECRLGRGPFNTHPKFQLVNWTGAISAGS